MGRLEVSLAIGQGRSERAFDVTEQLAVEEILVQSGAVQMLVWLVGAVGVLVDRYAGIFWGTILSYFFAMEIIQPYLL